MLPMQFIEFDNNSQHYKLAFQQRMGSGKGIVWLGGFKSDMFGTKAEAIDEWAQTNQAPFLRFDYSGHGCSEGDFANGTISRWLNESLFLCERLLTGPQILVGSSMGGWLSLLMAQALAQKNNPPFSIAGMVLIAPAVDFTQKLMWPNFSDAAKKEILEKGYYARPSEYSDEPYLITRELIEDGRNHLLLDTPMNIDCPVHILQGQQDADVPWQHAMRVYENLSQTNASISLIKDGDHRLSRDQDIERLIAAIEIFRQP